MTNKELANMYERDFQKLIEEINLFQAEENIWKTSGSINNSSGNLALHLLGGLNYLIGSVLTKNGYIRDREKEFTIKGVERNEIIAELEGLKQLVKETILQITEQDLKSPYPIFFDKDDATISYVLTQLLVHLNYHLGQINYLRRVLD